MTAELIIVALTTAIRSCYKRTLWYLRTRYVHFNTQSACWQLGYFRDCRER